MYTNGSLFQRIGFLGEPQNTRNTLKAAAGIESSIVSEDSPFQSGVACLSVLRQPRLVKQAYSTSLPRPRF